MHVLTLLLSLFPASVGVVSPGVRLAGAPVVIRARATGDIGGTVADSAAGTPLAGGEVRVIQGENLIASSVTDAFGRYVIHNLPAGAYRVEVRYLGYRAQTHDVSIGGAEGFSRADFKLTPLPINLSAVEVATAVPLAVDTRTGNQIFKQNDYHGAPNSTTSQLLQQSIVGAARAPTGEVHIRGQHAEYTYYVDGVPVPSGISGSLNELFDPQVVNQIDFQTGGWDAEYGNKNAAVVNITTRIPTGGFHFEVSGFGGTFTTGFPSKTQSTNGQSLTLSTNAGKWGFFASGSRQSSAMRREPVVFDTLHGAIENFHNDGTDVFGFGKVQYTASDRDVVNVEVNRSRTRFAVPFDSVEGIIDDHQQDVNGFVNVGWRHQVGTENLELGRASELFVGTFFRDGSLTYTPGLTDSATFTFPGDSNSYIIAEDRNFRTTGAKVDYSVRPRHGLEFKTGVLASATSGHEDFSSRTKTGSPGPTSNSNLNGSDVGVYAQTAIAPSDRWELRTGVRFDNHNAPFAANQHQVSPRAKLSFFPDPANTFWIYYGRLFLPTNVEDLRAITSTSQGGVVAAPTFPERDHFVELGYVHRFPFGVVSKISAYRKQSTPGIDDATVAGTAIVTSVNIDRVSITGLEGVLEIRPSGPFSGYVNVAINHAYGSHPITGGFFPPDSSPGYFDLDHDQRVSGVASAVYSSRGLYLSATGIYGSGLTNGADPDSTYGRGLFDFNKNTHVDPNFIVNASAGYSFAVGRAVVRPQLYVDNVFNRKYLMKGVFFSGASVGRPRSLQFRLSIGT
ncbi:MAG TPA: TonB-dependent receptor [Gemmatimonadales bacterium]|nr:TonB-dependent receptor [Gemmatimonadales bacterium]